MVIYGPFKVDGEFIGVDGGAGNAAFDAKLRSANAEWGIRDLADLTSAGAEVGLALKDKVDMPANNLVLHFVKSA